MILDGTWEELALAGGIILLLLILSAFFSSSETALTAVSRPRMHRLAMRGDRRARAVLDLSRHRQRMITTLLLGNNLVNILASALATVALVQLFGEAGVAWATLVMTALVLVFAEVLPKTVALGNPERLALTVGRIVRICQTLFLPVTVTVHGVVRLILLLPGLRGVTENDREHREEELRGVIDLHAGTEPESRQEGKMLHSVLDLDDVVVSEVMTHRSNVLIIDLEDDVSGNIQRILDSPYTRIPLMRGRDDNIVGILHAKPLLRALRSLRGKDSEPDLEALAGKPWFVPETTTLLDQLQAFRRRREHFAVIVDEYGGLRGILTLEDILEEIVGEIDDEYDIARKEGRPQRQPDGSYVIDGAATLRDLNRNLDWNLPDGDAATLAGLVLHEARCIPEAGQVFQFHGFRFEILRRQRNRIRTLRVFPPSGEDGQTGD